MFIDSTKYMYHAAYIIIFPYFLHPMKRILLCWETFHIMSITTERYLAVCQPLLYRKHKLSHSSKVHLLTYIIPPIFMAVIINIPKFLEVKFVMRNQTNSDNITNEILSYDITPLRRDPVYVYYYIRWTKLIFTCIVPITYLLLLNIFISITIRRSTMFSQEPSQNLELTDRSSQRTIRMKREGSGRPNSTKAAQKTFLTLASLVMLYLVCNTPRLVLMLLDYIYLIRKDMDYCNCYNSSWFKFSVYFSHLLLVINSAVNFLIYFAASDMFKNVFLVKLRLRRNVTLSN